ncbi:MAG: hypothetical protein Q8T08_00815 [Ignavibacteria bacterium]|nr:hypothetical protein [Ignavibacteria bacterium]
MNKKNGVNMSKESEIDDEIRNSQGRIYYWRLKSLSLNYYVFNKNFEELKIPIENMKDPKNALLAWDIKKRDVLEIVQFEVIRRLLNYIFSAKALVDYTRNLISRWYSNTDFKNDYDKEIQKRFTGNEIAGFIEDLRNYSAHYSLPISRPGFSIMGVNTHNVQIEHYYIMSKSVLLQWDGWTEKGKKFLNHSPEDINIEEFTYKYFTMVEDFEHWLIENLKNLHKTDLDWLYKKSKQLKTLLDESND